MSFHFEYPRVIDPRRPGDFKPATPKYQVRWRTPVTTIVCDYFAIQRKSDDVAAEQAFFERMRAAYGSVYGPDCFEEMREVDAEGVVNSIAVAYWTELTRFALWKNSNPVNAWFKSADRETEGCGYWRETLAIPYDRMETIFSEPYYFGGVARTNDCELEAMYVAGYFGAMRDRLPISAIDELNSPYGDNVPVGNFRDGARKRVRVDVPPNLVSIRSGQFWAQAKGEQLDDYYENMRPKLETGMSYLSEHPEETGCLSMRHITHLNEKGDELRETCKHVYILSLKHLEDWTESHKSHLDIWKHALAMRRKYGAERDFVSWHEVFVIGTTPSFEYVNCHAGTGLLRFADIWGTV